MMYKWKAIWKMYFDEQELNLCCRECVYDAFGLLMRRTHLLHVDNQVQKFSRVILSPCSCQSAEVLNNKYHESGA